MPDAARPNCDARASPVYTAPCCGTARCHRAVKDIDAGTLYQDIRQRMVGLRWRRDHLEVIPVREHRTASAAILVDTERCVDVPCRRDLEPLHSARKGELVLCLREHVN